MKHLRPGQAAAIRLQDGTAIGSIGRLAEAIAVSRISSVNRFMYSSWISVASGWSSEESSSIHRYLVILRWCATSRLLVGSRQSRLTRSSPQSIAQAVADCRSVKFVGTYEGANIPEAKRSVTLRIEYRSDERTLRDEEVEERHRSLTSFVARNVSS